MAEMEERRAQLETFVKKHKVALIIGAAVVGFLMLSEQQQGGETYAQGGGSGGGSAPVYGDGGGAPDSGGGVDMDRWREEQRRSDREQRERVDTIREVERCYNPDTGETVEVSIHTGC